MQCGKRSIGFDTDINSYCAKKSVTLSLLQAMSKMSCAI
jgi:hypothetical protein